MTGPLRLIAPLAFTLALAPVARAEDEDPAAEASGEVPGGALAKGEDAKEDAKDEEEAKGRIVTYDAQLSLTSAYMWRGFDYSMREPSLTPYAELTLPLDFLDESSSLILTGFTNSALDAQTEFDDTQWGVLYGRDLAPGWSLQVGYLLYASPGTETLPTDGDTNPASFGGEFLFLLNHELLDGAVSASLSYSRGHSAYSGNEVNVFIESWPELPILDGLSGGPYFQADLTDQTYGVTDFAMNGFLDHLAAMEIGVQLEYGTGLVRLRAAASLISIPSSFVRAINEDSGVGGDFVRPWATIGVAFVQEQPEDEEEEEAPVAPAKAD